MKTQTLGIFALLLALPVQTPAQDSGVEIRRDLVYGEVKDSRSLKLDLVLPAQPGDQPRPLIVWIHGGGWKSGDKRNLGTIQRLVASGKYVGASINYRLSGEAKWPAQIHDCKAAIRWLRANAKQYGIDKKRIGVFGSSAGGHLSAFLATTGDMKEFEGSSGSPGESTRITCAAVLAGPSDFLAYRDFARTSWGQPNQPGGAEHDLFGHPLDADRAKVLQASPVTHASPDDPPVLILHGERDPVVPFNQAELLDEALRKAKAEVTFVRVINGGHGVSGHGARRIEAFFNRHLLGDADANLSAEPIVVGGSPATPSQSPTTAIGKLAADMKPGDWRALKTGGAEEVLREKAAGAFVDAESACWNPRANEVQFAGRNSKSTNVFLTYSVSENQWSLRASPPWRRSRAFDNNTVDPDAGSFYHHPENTAEIYYTGAGREEWRTLGNLPEDADSGRGSALVYSVPMQGLLRVFRGDVHFLKRGARGWIFLKKNLAMGTTRNVAEVVAPSGNVVLGGGKGSTQLYVLNPRERNTISPLPKVPLAEVAVGKTVLTSDPVSGDVLLLEEGSKRFFSLGRDAKAWKKLNAASAPFQNPAVHIVATPIPELGVIFFVQEGGVVVLYKHAP